MTRRYSTSIWHTKMIPAKVWFTPVCTNTDFWGEDLTKLEGFEAAVCTYLTQINENGTYAVMKTLLK